MDYYKDDLDRDRGRYSRGDERDYYDRRDSYEFERDIDYMRGPPPGPPPPDDPMFRVPRPLLPHPHGPPPPGLPPPPMPDEMLFKEPVAEGAVVFGSVVLLPVSPLEPRPKTRQKPSVCKTVFVGSLPDMCEERHLLDLFKHCGPVNEVRIARGRSFGHVEFASENAVERAIKLSGCMIKVENMSLPKACGKIHVDYAQDKDDMDTRRRVLGKETLTYSKKNASVISQDLHRDETYSYAARHVNQWLTGGACDAASQCTFFELLNNVNSRSRKLLKNIQDKDEEEFEYRVKKKAYLKGLADECKLTVEVFETATGTPKVFNLFTKPQRKSIAQWKDATLDIQERLHQKIASATNDPGSDEARGPPAKIAKVEGDGEAEVKLERALKEIEQLKVDKEVAVDKRDKQILQLKTLLAKFKKTCPEEWEKAIGGSDKSGNEDKDKKEKEEAEPNGAGDAMEEDSPEELGQAEIIDGVNLDDLNTAMNKQSSENSLASAAAAYAKMRKTIGSSSETSGPGLSEAEVAIVSVLATFLTVHPLGATIETITSYFKTFNPSCNSFYLEALLRRLNKVFQLSQDSEGSNKWWFLGFQTCYASPKTATETKKESA